jgi:hypothetical protein
MESHGSHDVANMSWDNFNLPVAENLSVRFSSHLGPTDLFKHLVDQPEWNSSIDPFSDPAEMIAASRDLAATILDRGTDNLDLMEVISEVFAAALGGSSNLPDAIVKRIVKHALALAQTSPEIFSSSFTLNQLARRCEFTIPEKSGEGHAHERYDILQWIVCFNLLGKGFDLEGWEPFVARYIGEIPDPSESVIRVSLCHGEVMDVTQGAKEAMDTALTYMSKSPPPFFSCKQAVLAVVEILGKELLPYTMPQSREELEAFNWDDVRSGDRSTYPEAPQPDAADFSVVKAVHKLSKEAKDKSARAIGMPHAGVPHYITYLQKWKRWRDIHAVYRTLYPKESIQMITDRVTFDLKNCKSDAAMMLAVDEVISKFFGNRKRAQKKEQLAREVAAKEAEAKEAEKKAKALEAEKARQEKEKEDAAQNEIAARPVLTRNLAKAKAAEKSEAIKKMEADILATEQKIQEADEEAARKLAARQRLRAEKRKLEEEEAKRRNREKNKGKGS